MNPSPGPAPSPDPNRELEVGKAYRLHADVVYRTAYRATFGDHEAAQDVTHETFAEAIGQWPKFRRLPASQQRQWLCGRARWRVIDRWRKISPEYLTDALPDQPDPSGSEEDTLAGITADSFWEAITTVVGMRAARAAYLRWNMEWTMTEIARHLGVDRATALRDLRHVLAAAQQPQGGSTSLRPGYEGKEA